MSKQFDSNTYENMIYLHGENALKWQKYSNPCVSSSFSEIIGLDQMLNPKILRLIHSSDFGNSKEDLLGSIISFNLHLGQQLIGHVGSNKFINAIGGMKHLTNLELNFRDVQFTEENIDALDLCSRIGELKALKKLNLVLRSCLNKENRVQQLTDSNALAQVTQLEHLHLDLSNDMFEDFNAEQLSQVLTKFQFLQTIELLLANNRLSKNGLKYLCDGISSLTNLEALKLDLTSNPIEDFQPLDCLAQLASLRSLEVILQNLDFITNIQQISSTLKNLRQLKFLYLDLQITRLTKDSLLIFSEAVKGLDHLTYLQIKVPFNDQLETTGIKYLSASLASLQSLSSLQLNLQGSCIGNVSIQDISSAILQLPQLIQLGLDIGYNLFDNQGMEYLTSSIANLTNLYSMRVVLNNTNIKEQGILQLNKMIENNLHKLSSLSLTVSNLDVPWKSKQSMRKRLLRRSKYLSYFNYQ